MATKHQALWKEARDEWIRNNRPSHEGYWYCVVGGGYLTEDTLTLDHDISRSRDPAKRYDQTNLYPMCAKHNGEKGSRSLRQYRDSKPSLRCNY
jgi:5-methylcytosine-specific restriction endonuclease McrA